MKKVVTPTTVQLQFTRCQIGALVFAAVVIGIPAAIFGIISFGRVLFGFGLAIGLPNEGAGIAAVISCIGISVAALITFAFRACEGTWWWE